MGIAVLGPLLVNGRTNGLAPRDRVVLEALALRPSSIVTAEQLADALWPDSPPATWSKVVQGSVVRLRKMLGTEAIETANHGYRLAVRSGDVDAVEFERLVARAREQLELGEPERASYTVGEALSLWRGRPLPDLDEWEPGRLEAQRLEELRRDAEEVRLEASLQSGRHREILSEAHTRVEEAPLRERRWELLALAQYRAGRQADALRTLHQVRTVLANELGLDPGPGIVALEQGILRQDPDLLARAEPPPMAATCPYLGLVPYDVGDAEGFFGREDDIRACLERIASSGLVVVVGPSGSGKSSLVRAGVAAALRNDGQRVVVITPGTHPMDAVTAVPAKGQPVALVVDQCEEAVSLCKDPQERARFFEALTRHVDRAPLVIALRADRFGDLAAHSDFARLVERGLFLLNPMSTDSLRSAIEGPARLAGLRLERGLVELLVREVEGAPGALPHLSHALRQTWGRREGNVLTLDGYRATGGIRNAIAQSAERLYDDLSPDQRTMLRDLMLRLVTPGVEGEPVRSPIPRRLLPTDAEHDGLLEQLVAARLVTGDEGVVELAHEALARAWPRLRGWLDEDAEGQRILRHLSVAADTWDGMRRPDSELYRGTRLDQALDWRATAQPDLTPIEEAFLEEGLRLAQREEQTAAQRARHQARINRRLRGLLASAAFLLIVALVAGTMAVGQANRADEVAVVADARRVAAQSQLTDRVDLSLKLAVAAHEVETSSESRAALLAALARSPQLTAFLPAVEASFWHLDVSADGDQVAIMDGANHIWFYDTDSFALVGDFDPFPEAWDMSIGGSADPIAFNPARDLLAIGILNLRGNAVRLIDARTRRPAAQQPDGFPSHAYANDVDFSPDGRFLAVSLSLFAVEPWRYEVYVWDLARLGRPVQEIELVGDTQYIEFSADGERLYTVPGWSSDVDPVVRVFDVATGREVRNLGELGQPLELSPDGKTLAHAQGSDVVLLRSTDGQAVRRLRGPQETIRQIRFSKDGSAVLAVAEGSTATVWETDSGRMLEHLSLGAGRWADARFSADGNTLLATVDNGLAVFDLLGDGRYVRRIARPDELQKPNGWVTRFLSPDGASAAVATWDPATQATRLRFVDPTTGEATVAQSRGWSGDNDDHLAWSPDGERLAVLEDSGGLLRVLDRRTGEVVAQRRFGQGYGLEYDDAGDRLLVDAAEGSRLVDADTLESLTDPVGVPGRRVERVSLLPDGRSAVFVTAIDLGSDFDFFGAARHWAHLDLETGEVLAEGSLTSPVVSAAVSPDGTRMAMAGAAGVELLDLATGEVRRSFDLSAGHEREGRHVTWSGDGTLVASSDSAGRVSLWDGRTGSVLGTIQPGETASSLVFLDDDRTLVIGGWDGSVYEWDTSVDHAVETACSIVGSGLTEDEWRLAFGSLPYIETC